MLKRKLTSYKKGLTDRLAPNYYFHLDLIRIERALKRDSLFLYVILLSLIAFAWVTRKAILGAVLDRAYQMLSPVPGTSHVFNKTSDIVINIPHFLTQQ